MVDEEQAEGDVAEESDDGSEDLEGESSGSEGEEGDDEEVEGEVEAEDAMEVDGAGKKLAAHPQDEVMAH